MSPPNATAGLVVDTDVASFVFKRTPTSRPHCVRIIPWRSPRSGLTVEQNVQHRVRIDENFQRYLSAKRFL
jgi:hypothetical protein